MSSDLHLVRACRAALAGPGDIEVHTHVRRLTTTQLYAAEETLRILTAAVARTIRDREQQALNRRQARAGLTPPPGAIDHQSCQD